MPDAVFYTSRVRIERVRGSLRRAFLPVGEHPILFGLHSEMAAHYGEDLSLHEPRASTLDYLVAAAAGCLTGTFGRALEARDIPAGEGLLVGEARGEVEKDEDGILVLRRIHVAYQLRVDPANRDAAERAHAQHARHSPVARTLWDSVAITTSLDVQDV